MPIMSLTTMLLFTTSFMIPSLLFLASLFKLNIEAAIIDEGHPRSKKRTNRIFSTSSKKTSLLSENSHSTIQKRRILTSSDSLEKLPQNNDAYPTTSKSLRSSKTEEYNVVENALRYLNSKEKGFSENLLLFRSGDKYYRSRRYRFEDFFLSLARFSTPVNVSLPHGVNTTYFTSPDHSPFYMGDPFLKDGHKYGLANILLFFANGLDMSVENDEQCDENNEYKVNGKLPLSNSCGQQGLSYSEMDCFDNPKMSCPVDYNMDITAVTFNRTVGAPPPLQCAPKSTIPLTGFWDYSAIREENKDAYANENGRVDIQGCCWWGRGFLQTKGICSFGRLNYYLGAQAARDGGQSLYPDIDFCINPEAVCASQYQHELIWISGLFLWVDRVQSYDEDGFDYMKLLKDFVDSGFRDEEFIKNVANVVKVGCHNPPCRNAGCLKFPCAGSSNDNGNSIVEKVSRTLLELDLFNAFSNSNDSINANTSSPIFSEPTIPQTLYPIIPSKLPSNSPSAALETILTRYGHIRSIFRSRKDLIESKVFMTNTSSPLYTMDGFLDTLRDLVKDNIGGPTFFLGDDRYGNIGHGLTNVALFLAHAMTRGLGKDSCEIVSNQSDEHIFNAICPMNDDLIECPISPITSSGILLSHGKCDIGRFNYMFGLPAYKKGLISARFKVDFCRYPEALCSNFTSEKLSQYNYNNTVDTSDVKYLIGLFFWVDRVQSYSWGYWNYVERLMHFVDDGMKKFNFVDEFSEMVINSPQDADLRKENFKAILQILFSDNNISTDATSDKGDTNGPSIYSLGNFSLKPVFFPTHSNYTGVLSPVPFINQIDLSSSSSSSQTIKPVNPEVLLPSNSRVDISGSSIASPVILTHLSILLFMR